MNDSYSLDAETAGNATGRQTKLIIRTPEGIVFPLIIADPITRFLALTIDIVCIYAISWVLSLLLSVVGFIHLDIVGAVSMVLSFAIAIGYPMLLEWKWRGQTVGKKLLRLQVVDEQGLRLQPSQIVIRNLLRAIDSLPLFYLVGGTAALLSARGQRLGDLAGNTVVIRHPKIEEPDLKQILPGKYNSFRRYPLLAARLRQRVSPAEAGIALRALMRRDALDPEARVTLFRQIADHFRGIVRFPAEAADGISDETYVRNVADILFAKETA